MAIFLATQAATMTSTYGWSGDIVTETPNQVVVTNGKGNTINYNGTFKYDAFGRITEGVLTNYTALKNYTLDYTITGLNIPGGTAFNLIQSGDSQYTLRTVLDGNDRVTGSYENDALSGFLGNDTIDGGVGNDTCYGGLGNDRFIASIGNDRYFGEEGFDTAQFNFSRSAYTITRIDSNTQRIQVTGAEEFILANSIERFSFSGNQITAFDIGPRENAGEAYRMYQAAFNRTPDANGLAGWINFLDQGGEALKMADQFIASTEFNRTYGLLNNTSFVQLLYNNVLGRNGEDAGVRGWVDGLNKGMTRAEVLLGFSESSENIAKVAPAISNGINYVEWWLN
ncbi:MAG: DUF4214 domain-containing protein [Beijerinckiaceae bacterium]|nr:DUF4214 domain-containing protein [Beijerinckiaceae bacterium]